MGHRSHLIEAEQSVIGGALFDDEAPSILLAMLAENDFADSRHAEILRAIAAVISEGNVADLVTVTSKLRETGSLDNAGGPGYLAEIVCTTPTAANVLYYARQIRAASARRYFEQVLADGANSLRKGENLTTVRERIDAALLQSVVSDAANTGPQHVAAAVSTVIKQFDEAHERRGAIPGIATGLKSLDRVLGGLHKSDLVILAARTAMGKTALALNLVEFIANSGTACLFFSLEMSREQLIERMIASHAGIDGGKARIGKLSIDEFERTANAAAHLHALPLLIDDSGALSLTELRARTRRVHRKHGLGLVVVDYLQLMRGERVENRALEVGSISRGLKALAKEINAPVLALAQLNRAIEVRTTKLPMLADLRDSGEIEQDADVILFINRPSVYDQKADPRAAELIIAKHRRGPCGTLPLRWEACTTTFCEP